MRWRKKNFEPKILNIVSNYLSERTVVYGRGVTHKVTAGVPQGSIIGPTLWNILYNGVLEMEMPEGIKLVA